MIFFSSAEMQFDEDWTIVYEKLEVLDSARSLLDFYAAVCFNL